MSSSSPPLTPPTSDSENEVNRFDDECRGYSSVHSTQSQRSILHLAASSPHPFAASTKANRAPPSYERRPFTPPATPSELPKKIPSVRTPGYQRSDSHKLQHWPPCRDESEQNLWDTTISSCIDGAKGKIDLSGNSLTFIPPSILDLRNLVVLPQVTRGPERSALAPPHSFKRSATAPAFFHCPQSSGTRPFLPAVTTNTLGFAAALRQKHSESRTKCEIELYLMRNAIRALPRALFALDCLVVLSLRQNKLTSLPPAIGELTRLRELNVASNRLAYLPSELLKLRLMTLHLHPNPFIRSPPHASDTKYTRKFGPLSRDSPVPALSEMILRFLLSPANSKTRSPTRLEASMTQPLDGLSLPGHFLRIIRASTAHGIASKRETDAEDDVTANLCPNSRHTRAGVFRDTAMTNGIFCTPVETVMEWVGVVAGVQVAESPQAWVPVLWRGCSNGCLAYMVSEETVDEEEAEVHDEPAFAAGTGKEGELFEFSDDEQ